MGFKVIRTLSDLLNELNKDCFLTLVKPSTEDNFYVNYENIFYNNKTEEFTNIKGKLVSHKDSLLNLSKEKESEFKKIAIFMEGFIISSNKEFCNLKISINDLINDLNIIVGNEIDREDSIFYNLQRMRAVSVWREILSKKKSNSFALKLVPIVETVNDNLMENILDRLVLKELGIVIKEDSQLKEYLGKEVNE